MFQTKEKEKTSEKELNGTKIGNLPNKEFKVMIIKMLTDLGRKMDEHRENYNRVRKYKKEPIRAEKYNN